MKRKVIVGLLFSAILFGFVFSYLNNRKDVTSEFVLDNAINSDMFAVKIENDAGSFVDYNGSTWPSATEYNLDRSKSECFDGTGNKLNINTLMLNYSSGTVNLHATSTTFCTLYFQKAREIDFTFYFIRDGYERRFTNKIVNTVYLEWDNENVESYCLTDSNNVSSCNGKWQTFTLADRLRKNATVSFNINQNPNTDKNYYAYLKLSSGYQSDFQVYNVTYDTIPPTCEYVLIYDGTNKVDMSMRMKDNFSVDLYVISPSGERIPSNQGFPGPYVTSEDLVAKVYSGTTRDSAGNESAVCTKTIYAKTYGACPYGTSEIFTTSGTSTNLCQ